MKRNHYIFLFGAPVLAIILVGKCIQQRIKNSSQQKTNEKEGAKFHCCF
jgi:hypothetical protein